MDWDGSIKQVTLEARLSIRLPRGVHSSTHKKEGGNWARNSAEKKYETFQKVYQSVKQKVTSLEKAKMFLLNLSPRAESNRVCAQKNKKLMEIE